ncbi:rod shape-determining protein MreC [Candidatus Uhrbacteria bacterium]|nr:rod shape-determining protein MreC [Candidatus Uhrbacteria bacterium]
MSRRIPLVVTLVGAVLAIAILYAIGALRPIQDGLRYVLMPVARVLSMIGTSVGLDTYGSDINALRAQVKDDEARLAAISVDYVKLRSLEEENRLLRETSKFLSTSGYDHVGARIIARNIQGSSATVLIDRGTDDGLEKGMAVIVGDGIFIGKLTSLSRNVSTVTLLSDSQSRVAASPLSSKHLFGLVQGMGNGVSKLTLVPQTEELKHNDVLVTAGTEEKVPADLAIALVDEVEGKPTDPFKTSSLVPLARVDQLSLVVVLRPAALRPK